MTKLEELINELCPDGVEYKKIGEVCDTITDYTAAGSFADLAKKVKYRNNPDYAQLIRTTDLKTSFKNKDKFVYVDENAFNYLWRVNLSTESLVLPNVGNCGEVYYVLPNDLPYENNVLGPNAILVRSSEENNRFLYHVFTSQDFQRKLRKIISPSGQTKFNKTNFKELQIPLPPLSIQSEIVHILDSFTLLTAELTAELTARQKQYTFYRDYLLDFSNEDVTKKIPDIDCSNVEYKRLGDIAKFTYGYTDKAKDYGDTRFIRITDILDNGYLNPNDAKYINLNEESKKYLLSKGDLLLARTGATYGKTLYVPNDEKAVFASFLIKIELDNTKILNRYYWHFSKSNLYWKQANKLVSTAGQPQFNTNAVSRVVIPVPPLSVQENIVKILDRFDMLNNDMSEGLPAEIEARKKQYEYYRDTLLSFDDKACSQIVKVERES